ncbi:MAG TPA: anhydro-N-acetylmuramic acid kinase [Candidatus Latescibacteria bacterium]|nr:anhydro-N-acetylmuramic acid kinase [Candidatus Latescibacterota bacterium]
MSPEEISRLQVRRIVGLMSGTSVDGIDAALVEISGHGTALRLERVRAAETFSFPHEVQEQIHALFDGHVRELCQMNFALGELFAEAALNVIRSAGFAPADVHLIGSHGQTVYHVPRGEGRTASSLQIGEPAVIAERTGITTIGDFRPRDIATGGEGAPLVPYADWVLCRRNEEAIALQNIGGIANLTVVTPRLEDVRAFDTGPGNMVIDAAVTLMTRGSRMFDEDGRIAASARPDESLVRELLEEGYFRQLPPKSTGREQWGRQFVRGVVERRGVRPDAVLVSTLTEFVARSIADAYARFVLPHGPLSSVYLSGGGARNPVLRRRITELLAPVPVGDSSVLGLPVDGKEAIAFAVLANETVCGEPSNVPGATGARGRRVLGKIVPA